MKRIPHGQSVSLEAVKNVQISAKNLIAETTTPVGLVSVPDTTRFDYMFPELQSDEKLIPVTPQTVDDLKRLGRAMIETDESSAGDTVIPSAYTYFGQFLNHEISLEAVSSTLTRLDDPNLAPLSRPVISESIMNARSPRLDLDSVYGKMRDGNLTPRQGDRMLIGEVSKAGRRPPNKDSQNDLPRRPLSANAEEDREALIGDGRNDENLIIAQLHVAFLRAHNALIDKGLSFSSANLLLRQHFQWLVIHDYLKRIADPEVVDDILKNGNRFYKPSTDDLYLPLEFSVAAYRFGHSLVRAEYDFNRNFNSRVNKGASRATMDLLFTFTALGGQLGPGQGSESLPENWIIEWEPFLDRGANRARRIDTHLTGPLFALRSVNGGPLPEEATLSVRNLLRGYLLRLPTGQAVAEAFGLEPMTKQQIEAAVGASQAKILDETGFSTTTPLWYYILAESAGRLSDHLGPVGSRIVAEVLIGLVRESEDSILKQPGWVPTLGRSLGRFVLQDLLELAGVLVDEDPKSRGGKTTMRIIDKVREKQARISVPTDEARAEAKKNRDLAVAAMIGGIHSKAWEAFMSQYADTPPQLMRLMATDGTLGNHDLNVKRAYLLGNSTCGSITPNQLAREVDTIDDGL